VRGVAPEDPLTLATAAVLLFLLCLLASLLPALRAARLELAEVLRGE
jgi:ABC-type lipoprotein release transport system permease subunit